MFFRQRSAQVEFFDLPGQSESDTIAAFRDLDRLNRAFDFTQPFVTVLPEWLGHGRCQRLEILDLGAGTGLLGRLLVERTQGRGWHWEVTNLDLNPVALGLDHAPRAVAGSVLDLPFTDGSFDLVIASQMTHHLSDQQITRHWREAWRVTRDALCVCDLHRNAGLYAMLWVSTRLLGISPGVREDALISAKRGFRVGEWRDLARQANLPEARVWVYYGTRIVLQARKRGRSP